ncbi:MAG: phosphorylase kinase [Planctomyces sp.]|nr:phosphorylase kinase [Planctomyces sp.]
MTTIRWIDIDVRQWVAHLNSVSDVSSLCEFLVEQGTFDFPTLPNGLFSAAAGHGDDFEVTGYANIWVRDNVHIAFAHDVTAFDPEKAIQCTKSLTQFFATQRPRFRSIIEGRTSANEPMNRPHIRFNGSDLSELPEKWSHAQNDALGYFLWILCHQVMSGKIQSIEVDWNVAADLVRYWQTIKVWSDEDSGHWEETRKIAASSIGTALAGLKALETLVSKFPEVDAQLASSPSAATISDIQSLIASCEVALKTILPFECRQEDLARHRRYDSALLFLIYPLQIVDAITADQIIADVTSNLEGEYGIRRYQGDSYWCANYKQLLDASVRTSDFSDSLEQRDRLLIPGKEAQWCIFDPILSCIFGQRYCKSGSPNDLIHQKHRLQRSLNQMTPAACRFPQFRCPESWYFENGSWGPNDITPLLWTQANLLQALYWMERSLSARHA